MIIHKYTKTIITWVSCALILLTCAMQRSEAHPMLRSQVEVTTGQHFWLVTLKLPTDRLEVALKQSANKKRIAEYVIANIRVNSANQDHNLWAKQVIRMNKFDGEKYWRVDLKLTPPKGNKAKSVDIDYQVISEKIITHKAIFWLMQSNTTVQKEPIFLGTLTGKKTRLSIKAQ